MKLPNPRGGYFGGNRRELMSVSVPKQARKNWHGWACRETTRRVALHPLAEAQPPDRGSLEIPARRHPDVTHDLLHARLERGSDTGAQNIIYIPQRQHQRCLGRAAWVGKGRPERAGGIKSGSPVDPKPAATSRSTAASTTADFYACAAPPSFGAPRRWRSSHRARRCALPRAHMR